MEVSKWRPSPGTVFGLLALTVAVAGTAMAGPLATRSVLNKGEKKQVKKLAKGQVNKLAPGLAVASARSANTANSADTAGNADKLDGQDAAAFAPAGEVHSPSRIVLNDPTPGDSVGPISDLVVSGPFIVRASCAQNASGGVNEAATVQVLGPVGMSASGVRSDGNDQNLADAVAGFFQVVLTLSSSNEVRSGHATVVAPSGEALSVSASAEVNDDPLVRECVFGVTAIGP